MPPTFVSGTISRLAVEGDIGVGPDIA